jgi:hypothetical protein
MPLCATPSAGLWLHEIEFDGYRVQVHLNKGKRRVTAWSIRRRRIDRFATHSVERVLRNSATAATSRFCTRAVLPREHLFPIETNLS